MSTDKVTLGLRADIHMPSFMWKLQSVPEVKIYFRPIKRTHKSGRLLEEQYKRRQTFPEGRAGLIKFYIYWNKISKFSK